jgi:aspartate/methionine/tyrosine aminotransferase
VPRFPGLSAPTRVLPGSILDGLKRRAAVFAGPVIPLHIGDTHLAPPERSRLGALDFSIGGDADLYRYSPPPGKQRLLEALVEKLPETGAIYISTPNNPDGKVLSRAELDAVARVARRHDLWVLSDEVYFTSVDRPALDEAVDRILAVLPS